MQQQGWWQEEEGGNVIIIGAQSWVHYSVGWWSKHFICISLHSTELSRDQGHHIANSLFDKFMLEMNIDEPPFKFHFAVF